MSKQRDKYMRISSRFKKLCEERTRLKSRLKVLEKEIAAKQADSDKAFDEWTATLNGKKL